ncbi:hypothetical protein V496_02913 [Pseudogymnoascus sp. VKM F-4515 (FW-2607)]|nr:hypothetical protein V496_02913 [Pseudogymnoascus sp. VKM F-4515 (FW-2607)]
MKDFEVLSQTATSHIDGFSYTSAPAAAFLGTPLTTPASRRHTVKYLKINQAYSMSIVDTAPELAATSYRTSVRISFDDQQRQNPEDFWHLWMKGSGAEGLYQRENNLQAVELVQSRVKVCLKRLFLMDFQLSGHLEPTAVRGAISWCALTFCPPTSVTTEAPNQLLQVELLQIDSADRKMSTEVQIVMNTPDKLNQQITQVGTEIKGASDTPGDSKPARRKNTERKQN